jgi:phosphatidylglycerol:prolipoprotein diacylglycerol transferase
MPQGFSLGPLYIHFYGILVMAGAVGGAWIAGREARRRGLLPDIIWDCLPWALIGGIIGARLWHVFTPPQSMVDMGITTEYYLQHPLDLIAVWKGGLGIPGAVIGGVVSVWMFAQRRKMSLLLIIDMIAPGLAFAQAVGRWGNFVNQELYGSPTGLPWGIFIEPKFRIPGYESISNYHPLFLYESIWNLLNMALLLWMGRRFVRQLKSGDIFLVYLVFYSIGRFFLEFLRLDPSNIAGVNFNQSLMAVTALVSALIFYSRHRTASSKDILESDVEE